MKRLTVRDLVATVIVLAVVVPFVGYSIRGSMPLLEDPRGMAGIGIVGGIVAFAAFGRAAFGRAAFGRSTFGRVMGALAAVTIGFAIAALVAETSWALLVPMVAGIVVVWALAVAHDAGYLATHRARSHG